MKKKGIILSIIGIFLVSTLTIILISKNSKKYIMYDGMMLAMTLTDTDGNTATITEFPSGTNYTADIDCENARGLWLPKEDGTGYEFVLEEITGKVTCNIAFKEATDSDKLINVIQAEKTRTDENDGICSDSSYTDKSTCESNNGIWWGVYDEKITSPKEDTYANITSAGYGTTSQFSSTSSSSTSGTTLTDDNEPFKFENGQWTSVTSVMDGTGSTYYHIKMPVTETGYYQLCYTMSSGSTSNRLYVYKNTEQSLYVSASSSAEKSGCVSLGKLTGGTDYIKVARRAKTTIATVTFYLQMTNEMESVDAGLRYEGAQPNNHVWFNNEIWRIIGYVPTKDANGNDTQLVKIIRNESIGTLTFHNSTYVGSSLYNLLNTYYYGAQDGTKSGYCYVVTANEGICNYESIGLNTISRNMIEPVQWAIGMTNGDSSVGAQYIAEVGTYTTTSGGINIGLMNITDYGYSVIDDDCERSIQLTEYSNLNFSPSCVSKAWLYGQGNEWSISPIDSQRLWYVINIGSVSGQAGIGHVVRPVMYLDAGVYKISGSGTMADPYIIGM